MHKDCAKMTGKKVAGKFVEPSDDRDKSIVGECMMYTTVCTPTVDAKHTYASKHTYTIHRILYTPTTKDRHDSRYFERSDSFHFVSFLFLSVSFSIVLETIRPILTSIFLFMPWRHP